MAELDPNKRKIVIATNSLTAAMKPAYSNHNQFWFNVGKDYGSKYQFIYVNPGRLSIDRFRNLAAETAIKYEADYIVWLDDDVLVPMDGFKKLLDACENGAQCAAGNVIVRGYPYDFMAFHWTGEPMKSNLKIVAEMPYNEGDLWSEVKKSRYLPEGLFCEKVGAVGFSFAMIAVAPLKKMVAPYFLTAPNHTEDVFYCFKLHEVMGEEVKIVIDWSIECNHILGEETISRTNRSAYKKYFETINPHVLEPGAADKIELDSEKPTDYVSALNKIVNDDLANIEIVEV